MTRTYAGLHGTPGAYNGGCRCDVCRARACTRVVESYRRRLAERVLVGGRWFAPRAPTHGRVSTYKNWGCRCESCRATHSAYNTAYHARQRSLARAGTTS